MAKARRSNSVASNKSRAAPARRRLPFDYSLDFRKIDFRRRRDLYRIGTGEQGVLLVEPYKSEILPHWRFKTPAAAKRSATAIFRMFRVYLKADDFPGADMARKFLQMGWTRARRYANHPSGRKYDPHSGTELPRGEDREKAAAAALFYERYVAARQNAEYVRQKNDHIERFEVQPSPRRREVRSDSPAGGGRNRSRTAR